MRKYLIVSVFVLLLGQGLWAQEGSYNRSGNVDLQKGIELYDKAKYAAARSVFESYIEQNNSKETFNLADAHYYRALCAVVLFNDDAEFLVKNFLKEYPQSPRTSALPFIMGNYHYYKKSYGKALFWYKKVDLYDLDVNQNEEFYFKSGYCYFVREKIDSASAQFVKVKDGSSKYAIPGKYFYGHIAYSEQKYETALKVLKPLESDDLFGAIIPYYMVQIYYYQNENQTIIEYAPQLLDSGKTHRVPEIKRILGEAYYKTQQFAQAVPYLLAYKEHVEDFQRTDAYQLAFAYYKIADYQHAAEFFSGIQNLRDSLSQGAFYHLGYCYVQLGQKDKALLAFQEAAGLDKMPDVKEDAAYNYAKLSYELSFSPFNDAIQAFKEYLKNYPNSRHRDEVYSHLSMMFLSTKNYSLAIETLNQIEKKTPELTEAYQRVTYFRGLEKFNDGEFRPAIELFDQSLKNAKFNLTYRALAKYWRAEAYYRIGDYAKATTDYNDFILTSGAFGSNEYKDAHYNLAYAFFKQKKYDDANIWFRKYIAFTDGTPKTKLADSYNRIGDGFFIAMQYDFAVEYYAKAIEANERQVDYALFQKAFSLGLLKRYDEEITAINTLTKTYPKSAYFDDALYERANAYKYLNQFNLAIENYQIIVDQYNESSYRPKALLQVGLLDYNTSKEQDALVQFKTLIQDYPKSDEAQKALLMMKNIYIELNQVDEYIEFANNHSVETEVTKIEADSLTYTAAANLYMNSNCQSALPALKKYIEKYPEGRDLLNAHYFKADCEFSQNDYANALVSYEFITKQKVSEYTEEALLRASFITYRDTNYKKTIKFYQQLVGLSSNQSSIKTAKIGLMHSYYKTAQFEQARIAALAVLPITEGAADLEREVHYILAKSLLAKGDTAGAQQEFTLLVDQPKTEEGAEANYMIILFQYLSGQHNLAIASINQFKTSNTSHQKWVAKSFMIWSDIFKAKADYFMARATLESVIKHYPNTTDGVKAQAIEKLTEIELIEQQIKAENEAKALQSTQEETTKLRSLLDEDSKESEQHKENQELVPNETIE